MRFIRLLVIGAFIAIAPVGTAVAAPKKGVTWAWSDGGTSTESTVNKSALDNGNYPKLIIKTTPSRPNRSVTLSVRDATTTKFRVVARGSTRNGSVTVDPTAHCRAAATCAKEQAFRVVLGSPSQTLPTFTLNIFDDSLVSKSGEVIVYATDEGSSNLRFSGQINEVGVNVLVERQSKPSTNGPWIPMRSQISGTIGGSTVNLTYNNAPKSGITGTVGDFAVDFWQENVASPTSAMPDTRLTGTIGQAKVEISRKNQEMVPGVIGKSFAGTLGSVSVEVFRRRTDGTSASAQFFGRTNPLSVLFLAYAAATGEL